MLTDSYLLRSSNFSSVNMTKMIPDALVKERILTSVCGGLVVIDKGNNVAHFVSK